MKSQQKGLQTVRYQANLLLQILIQLNIYASILWAFTYGFHILYDIHDVLVDIHGYFLDSAYIVALLAESWRLYVGYSGNLRSRAGDLTIFLAITALIQLPILLFLFLSAHSHVLAISVLTSIILCLMVFEFIVGIYTWQKFSHLQEEMYKLKRQLNVQKQIKL